MRYWLRIGAFAALSLLGHLLFARGVSHLPARPAAPRLVTVEVRVREPPQAAPAPPPEPPKPAEPPKAPEPRRQPVHEAPARKLAAIPANAPRGPTPRSAPPTERPATGGPTTDEPQFGASLDSTSERGTGPAIQVGNTLQTKQRGPAPAPAKVRPLAAPVQAYEVTKMPLPKGRCAGEYTDAARQAGLEGTVILDLVVGPDGAPRDITVVQGLDHGLTEAALAALKRCRFTPGERNGEPVPVRVRGFKIRFFLQTGD
ncbi:MAG TPA: TonB family protein [Polyangia bacterium]|jgi:protein TonB